MKEKELCNTFYCSKCHTVSLIQISPNDKQIKIFTICKCHKQFINSDLFLKNYFKENIPISFIKNEEEKITKEFNKKRLQEIINNYESNKNKISEHFMKIKNEIIEDYNNKIKKVEEIYLHNKGINDKIDKLIQIIISSYKSNPLNYSNIQNVINNLKPNPYYTQSNLLIKNATIKNIENYFKNNFYIKQSIDSQLNKIKSISDSTLDKMIIQINSNSFARKIYDRFISIFQMPKLNGFKFETQPKGSITSLIINKNKNLISSHKNDSQFSIKIWPNFSEISKIIEKIESQVNQFPIIDLSPILEFNTENKIKSIIDIGNNMISGYDNICLYIFKYDLDSKEINLLSKYDKIGLTTFKYINIKNKNKYQQLICGGDNYKLYIFNIPDLKLINEMKLVKGFNSTMLIEQINDTDIIIGTGNSLKVVNLIKFQIKLSKNINEIMNCIIKLRDNTLLVGFRDEIKRYSLKNFEELTPLLDLSYDSDDDFDGYYYNDFDGDSNNVFNITELEDGKILVSLRYSIDIYQLTIG